MAKELDVPKRSVFKVGNRVRLLKPSTGSYVSIEDSEGRSWIVPECLIPEGWDPEEELNNPTCFCGSFLGYPEHILDSGGEKGIIIKVYPSQFRESGFSLDDYDILMDSPSFEGVPVHVNSQYLESTESPYSFKVEEPTPERLERLKLRIKELEQVDPERARQLYEQYEQITAGLLLTEKAGEEP